MTNTILILGANTLQLPLIEKANYLGYDTLVVSPVETEPGHKIAKYSEKYDVVDEEGVLALAEKYDICGVITDQTDLPVRTMAYVSEKKGLCGNPYDVAKIFTDKYLMREKCRKLGIKTLEYRLCTSMNEAVDFFNHLNRPIILKPVDNQGSKGVNKVDSLKELYKKFPDALKYSRSHEVLVEEFIVGREFVVEGICVNYEFRNLCCGDTEYFDIPNVFSAKKREFPSVAPDDMVSKVLDLNERIVRGFGFKQGITHGEYIMVGDDVVLIEIAGRGGGVFISSDLIHIQTGLETEEFLLGIATGKIKELPDFSFQNKSCCYISFFLPEGIVQSVKGTDDVAALPYTHHHNFENLMEGMKIKPMQDKTSRFFVIVEATDHQELMDRIAIIKQMLDIRVITSNGMKGIIWN